MANLLDLLKSYTNVIIFLYFEVNINKIIFKPAFYIRIAIYMPEQKNDSKTGPALESLS